MPVCIESCPTRALDAGPLDELKARYGDVVQADGFSYSKRTRPAVVFKPKLQKTG
jgi:anaerobic dimethyl sulfoxide reductase subunit B (iron-sulfur subunit)